MSTTAAPFSIGTVHAEPQFRPPTLDVTVPDPCLLTDRSNVSGTNLAVAVRSCDIERRHEAPLPAQAPCQLSKRQPAAGDATRVADPPLATETAHTEPQSSPPTLDVTVPEPSLLTVRSNDDRWNVAVVDRSLVAANTHVAATPADSHELLHPTSSDFAAATAVNVTDAPRGTAARHAASHGAPSTVADTEPGPDAFTVNFTVCVTNEATTVRSALATTTQSAFVPADEHAPLQVENTEPTAGSAVKVTDVPAGTDAKHPAEQGAPSTEADTEPDAPDVFTVNAYAVRPNIAVVDRSASAVRVHTGSAPADKHELVHPEKPDKAPGTAVNVTDAPRGTASRHAASHGSPSTVADTEPGPDAFTVNSNEPFWNHTVVD